MKKTKRMNIFETNSSSIHSLVFEYNPPEPDLPINPETNKVSVPLRYFGKETRKYFDQKTKLQYILTCIWCFCGEDIYKTYNSYYFEELEEIVKKYIPSCSGIEITSYSDGGIDHQMYPDYYGECPIFSRNSLTVENMESFIFNDNVGLSTGCD